MRTEVVRHFGLALAGVFFFLPGMAQQGPQREDGASQDIVLVLDNSGSMKKTYPAFLTKAAVKAFVQKASASTRIAIVIFDSDARLAVPLTSLSKEHPGAVLSGLAQIDYRGLLTHIPAAVERAVYELKLNSRPNAAKSIILLTDGIIDTGNSAKDLEVTAWLREELATDAARHEIELYGIALTAKADFRLMQSLALTTKGDYFRATQAVELTRAFERIHRLIGRQVSDQSPATPDLSSPPPKEIPAFVTLEIMDPEHITADSAASPAAIEPTVATATNPLTEQEPVAGWPLPSHDRALVDFTVAGLGILAVAIWMLGWRKRKDVASGSTVYTPTAFPELVPSACLYDLKGVTGQQQHPLSHPVTVIGRVAPDPAENANSVIINNNTISRRHALIEYKHHSFCLIEQKSRNGTFVNGQRISEETRLRHGDRIRFHQMEFQFELAASRTADETCLMSITLPENEALIAKGGRACAG